MGKIKKVEEKLKNSNVCRTSLKNNKSRHVSLYNTRSKRIRFDELPVEILTHIFSYLSHEDLFQNIRPVCSVFLYAASSQSLWKKIQVGPEVSTEMLERWLEISPKLRILELNSRLDAAVILKKVFCKYL